MSKLPPTPSSSMPKIGLGGTIRGLIHRPPGRAGSKSSFGVVPESPLATKRVSE